MAKEEEATKANQAVALVDGAPELAGPGLHCHSLGRLGGPNQRHQQLEINEHYQHVDNPKTEARFI